MNKTAFAALALLAASSAFASNNLVTNGSFEQFSGSLNHGSWGEFATLSGWNIAKDSKTSTFEIQQASEYSHESTFNPHYDGQYYLELNSNNLSAISQTLTTKANTEYTLTFGYADRSGSKGESSMKVYWNGTKLENIEYGETNWKTFTYKVTGTGSDTLKFVSTGPKHDTTMGSYLDGVSVTATAAPVPEPESYAMLLAGLGVMATIARRRSKAAQG